MKKFIEAVQSGFSLKESQMTEAMTLIMYGQATEDEIEQFLRALSDKGETIEELTGAAKVLRSKAKTITAPPNSIDCCGTGGDASGTYNISTAVALVAASCGVPVAKHGNRASSSKSGAADVLDTLGVNLNASQATLEKALTKFNFAFLMAPNHHHAMKHVAAARKKIGTKTIFNLLGPLINPAQTKHQLIGVYNRKWLIPMAETLKNLGSTNAWIVHGSDGLDEITTTGPTYAAKLENGKIHEQTFTPDDFNLDTSSMADLKGGDAKENAAALLNLLQGKKNAYRDIVIANTAAVLCINGTIDLKTAAATASNAIDSGLALKTLENYINFTKENT